MLIRRVAHARAFREQVHEVVRKTVGFLFLRSAPSSTLSTHAPSKQSPTGPSGPCRPGASSPARAGARPSLALLSIRRAAAASARPPAAHFRQRRAERDAAGARRARVDHVVLAPTRARVRVGARGARNERAPARDTRRGGVARVGARGAAPRRRRTETERSPPPRRRRRPAARAKGGRADALARPRGVRAAASSASASPTSSLKHSSPSFACQVHRRRRRPLAGEQERPVSRRQIAGVQVGDGVVAPGLAALGSRPRDISTARSRYPAVQL